MYFNNILNINNNKDEILLGHKNEKEIKLNIKENPSIIITGETGTGKSIILDQILLQLFYKHTSLEMGFIGIDTCGVELNNYIESRYNLISASNNLDKSYEVLRKVYDEILRRKQLLEENEYKDVDEYNNFEEKKLPLIVVAIDDDKMLLRDNKTSILLKSIIENVNNLNIFIIFVTNSLYNMYFIDDYNTEASTLISFDFSDKESSKIANIKGGENLHIGEFILKINGKQQKCHNFEFDDKIIEEIMINKKN